MVDQTQVLSLIQNHEKTTFSEYTASCSSMRCQQKGTFKSNMQELLTLNVRAYKLRCFSTLHLLHYTDSEQLESGFDTLHQKSFEAGFMHIRESASVMTRQDLGQQTNIEVKCRCFIDSPVKSLLHRQRPADMFPNPMLWLVMLWWGISKSSLVHSRLQLTEHW